MSKTMKLMAQDAEDLQVVSAHLQDAIVPICDLAYFQDEQRFVLVANRFKWEVCHAAAGRTAAARSDGDGTFVYERTHCGVQFRRVRAVRTRQIDLRDRGQMLNLLAVECGAGTVDLHFGGGGCVRLEVEAVDVQLEDIGEPWPTAQRPTHRLDDLRSEAAQ